jgi:hypothetical protein
MDKSFNDQELSDIMKEIEALEEEFSGDVETDKIEASSVMEELAEMELDQAVPTTNKAEAVLPFEKKTPPKEVAAAKTSTQSSMSFKVQGDMNLELNFEIGGKTIALEVTEAGLTIQMEGGMTFSVPVSDAHSVKKAV